MTLRLVKLLSDRLIALILLGLLLPVFLLVFAAVFLQMGRPIFFAQPRPGYQGHIFTFYKFRTMTSQRDSRGVLLPDNMRLTAFGRFLRATSLDELPQLWNILLGDMSFVGPRPLLVKYLGRYTPEQARRHEVKPGITGWAQVNGRNAIDWEEKFSLDVWYVDHWSLWLDLKILGLTLLTVIRRQGINQTGQATMSEFQGDSTK
ncbi:MAG: sugar transferase [Cyanobacteria bacterium P01_F01_bin.56]